MVRVNKANCKICDWWLRVDLQGQGGGEKIGQTHRVEYPLRYDCFLGYSQRILEEAIWALSQWALVF